MNGEDYMNNNYQQSEAMYAAGDVFKEVAAEYARISGGNIQYWIYIGWKMQMLHYSY